MRICAVRRVGARPELAALAGRVVRCMLRVACRYLRSRKFWLDVCSILPADIAVLILKPRLWGLFRLNRALRIGHMFHTFTDDTLFRMIGIPANFTRIAKLFGFEIILAHWMACLFYLLGTPSADGTGAYVGGGDGWVQRYSLTGLPLGEQYIASLYWAFYVITTVGLGDFVPTTDAETAFLCVVTLVAGCYHGYVFANFATVIHSATQVRVTDLQYQQYSGYSHVSGRAGRCESSAPASAACAIRCVEPA